MRILILLLLAFALSMPLPAQALNEERDLKAVFIGRFANFIQLPSNQREQFHITVIDDNPFDDLLDNLYEGKTIHGKSITIKYVTRVDEIGECDILFVTVTNQEILQEAISYAQNKSILTISDSRGFAQRGGIIQLYFVMQQVKLKINYAAAQKSNIKIDAPLLNIAEVIRKEQP